MKKKIILLAIFPLFHCLAEKDIYSDCLNKAGTINNTVVMSCSGEASYEYKKQINKYYNMIYSRLKKENPKDAKTFEESQKGWLKYRNNYCDLAGKYVGMPMYDYCPMLINEIRSKELKELAGDYP